MATTKSLFPSELYGGAKGPAVFVLQVWLLGVGYDTKRGLALNGIYGEETEKAVKSLQSFLGIERSGRFDQKTKLAVKNCLCFGIDFDSINDQLVRRKNIVPKALKPRSPRKPKS